MNLKIIAGIVLLFGGMGLGVWEWMQAPFNVKFPTLGLISMGIGIYLIVSGAMSAKKKTSTLAEAGGALAGITATVVGFTLGQIAYEKMKEAFTQQGTSLTPAQIDEIERTADELYRQGRMPPEKYIKVKQLIQELRRRRR